MSTPQNSLFSLLSLCLKFLQSVEIWQSYDKKISLHSFFETRCIAVIHFLIGLLGDCRQRPSVADYSH